MVYVGKSIALSFPRVAEALVGAQGQGEPRGETPTMHSFYQLSFVKI